jgi:hypothetical protein
VARLRAAHLAAKKAQVSRFDQVISGGRRFFDSAHKMTVLGLLGLTGTYSCPPPFPSYPSPPYSPSSKANTDPPDQQSPAS